jgi:hypothetical protein
MLVPWGIFAQRISLVDHLEEVPIPQRQWEHSPQTKLTEFLVAILSGCAHLQDISRSSHPLDQYQAAAPRLLTLSVVTSSRAARPSRWTAVRASRPTLGLQEFAGLLPDGTSVVIPECHASSVVAGGSTITGPDPLASPYFAPTGRSNSLPQQKRAVTDAYRTRFGEPSRHEIHGLRRQRGDAVLLPSDFNGTDQLLPIDRTNLALENARAREQPAPPTSWTREEILAHGRRLLRGDADECAGI